MFEQELFNQFTYKRDRPFFHSFPADVSYLPYSTLPFSRRNIFADDKKLHLKKGLYVQYSNVHIYTHAKVNHEKEMHTCCTNKLHVYTIGYILHLVIETATAKPTE